MHKGIFSKFKSLYNLFAKKCKVIDPRMPLELANADIFPQVLSHITYLIDQ